MSNTQIKGNITLNALKELKLNCTDEQLDDIFKASTANGKKKSLVSKKNVLLALGESLDKESKDKIKAFNFSSLKGYSHDQLIKELKELASEKKELELRISKLKKELDIRISA